MSVFVLIGIISIILGVMAYSNSGALPVKVQLSMFFVFFFFSGTVFTSMIFAELGSQKEAIPALMLPVSPLERFFVGWVYSFVIFQLIFLASFYAVDAVVLQIGNIKLPVRNTLMKIDFDDSFTLNNYMTFLFFHSIAFLGAIFFNKMHFIKAAFTFFITLIVVVFFNFLIVRMVFGENIHISAPFDGMSILEGKTYYYLDRTETGKSILAYMLLALTLLLWTTAYFKLKEKQV